MVSCLADVYMFDEPSSYLDIKQRLKASQVIRSLLQANNYVVRVIVTGASIVCLLMKHLFRLSSSTTCQSWTICPTMCAACTGSPVCMAL